MELEFTGERFVPGRGDPQLLYEHLHRYIFASLFVGGGRVLDLGCGEGYGSYLLSRKAQHVIGLDRAFDVLRYATKAYPLRIPNFICSDGKRLPFKNDSFDVVVAFELIEHIEDQAAVLEEAVRVLTPCGFLLISTPNKKVYSDDALYKNPYHVKEFYIDEFFQFLRKYFSEVTLFGQKILPTSFIWTLEPGAGNPSKLQVHPIDSKVSGEALTAQALPDEPVYMVALCCKQPSPSNAPDYISVLVDSANALISHLNLETVRLNERIKELGSWGKRLSEEVSEKNAMISGLQSELQERFEWAKQLEEDCRARDAAIAELQVELQTRTQWTSQLDQACKERDRVIARYQKENQAPGDELAAIKGRWIYRVLRKLHLLPP